MLALAHGADVLEIDVRLSRDKQVVVIHDESVDRTCNGVGKVQDLSLSQLKKLDASFHFARREAQLQKDQTVPLLSLSELFQLLPDVFINIDIKDNSEKAALAVAEAIKRAGRENTVNVGSFHANALAHFRLALPQVTTAATQIEVANLYFRRQRYAHLPFQYLQIPIRYRGIPLATRRFIQHAQARGIKCVYWTINDTRKMNQLLALGVNGIVTDRVDLAAPLLGKANRY